MVYRQDHAVYWLYTCTIPVVVVCAALQLGPVARWPPAVVAGYIALGPIAMAICCSAVYASCCPATHQHQHTPTYTHTNTLHVRAHSAAVLHLRSKGICSRVCML